MTTNNLCPACEKIHRNNTNSCPYCAYRLESGESWGCQSDHAKIYIKWLQGLLSYLSYFQTRPVFTEDKMGYIYYNETIHGFIEKFYEYKIPFRNEYKEILGKIRLCDVTPEIILRQNIEGIICIFIYYERGDRWAGGWIAKALQTGNYALLLERLKFLLDELGIDTNVKSISIEDKSL